MANGMWGAPVGIQASEENIRQNISTGFMAQKLLGEIAQQPVELALKQAQALNTGALTRLHNTDAATKERAAEDLAQLRRLDIESRAEAAAIDQAKLEGRDLTIADRPAGGFSKGRSAAEPIERFIELGYRNKVPLDKLFPYMKQAVDLRKDEAQTTNAATQAEVHQLTAQKAMAERLGTAAQSALQGPQSYAQARALGLLPPGLPLNFEMARPFLRQLVDTSLTVKDQAELKIKERQAAADESRAGAAQVSAAASKARADAYVATAAARRDVLKKALGPGTEEARDAKVATTEAKRMAAFKAQLTVAPIAPLKFESRHEGKLFTGTDRKIYRYDGVGPPSAKYPNGVPLLLPMSRESVMLQHPAVKEAISESQGSDD